MQASKFEQDGEWFYDVVFGSFQMHGLEESDRRLYRKRRDVLIAKKLIRKKWYCYWAQVLASVMILGVSCLKEIWSDTDIPSRLMPPFDLCQALQRPQYGLRCHLMSRFKRRLSPHVSMSLQMTFAGKNLPKGKCWLRIFYRTAQNLFDSGTQKLICCNARASGFTNSPVIRRIIFNKKSKPAIPPFRFRGVCLWWSSKTNAAAHSCILTFLCRKGNPSSKKPYPTSPHLTLPYLAQPPIPNQPTNQPTSLPPFLPRDAEVKRKTKVR